jgi:hypothetical protein
MLTILRDMIEIFTTAQEKATFIETVQPPCTARRGGFFRQLSTEIVEKVVGKTR